MGTPGDLAIMPAESNSDKLGSCTDNVRAYACDHHGRRFVFIDTPGFNSSKLSNDEVLNVIAHQEIGEEMA